MKDGEHNEVAETPRPVSRGVKHQLVNLGLDSLYLVVEYPWADVFARWAQGAGDLSTPRLYEGIVWQGMVLKRGAQGYKLSVWDGDARLFLTDRVDERLAQTRAQGQGMGVMLQLGPKWLRLYGEPFAPNTLRRNVHGQLMLFGLSEPERYPIRINRLDIALDVLGLDMATFSLDEWQHQWVGYAKPRHFHLARRTGALSGLTVGTRKGNVCLTVYDKVAESQADGDSRFWRSVWGVADEAEVVVTRFEWSFRPYQARFAGLRYLAEYTFEGFLGLLNYATLVWGRLCVPRTDRNHTSRWVLAPLWEEVRAFIEEWGLNYERYVRPRYELKPDLSPAYLKAAAGWLAGLQARVGVEKGAEGPTSLAGALSYLQQAGYSPDEIARKAAQKWEVLSRLAGEGGAQDDIG